LGPLLLPFIGYPPLSPRSSSRPPPHFFAGPFIGPRSGSRRSESSPSVDLCACVLPFSIVRLGPFSRNTIGLGEAPFLHPPQDCFFFRKCRPPPTSRPVRVGFFRSPPSSPLLKFGFFFPNHIFSCEPTGSRHFENPRI